MRSLHIESNIFYRYAKTTVASRLANTNNYSTEISFNAILPESAFITAFYIELDDQVYHAYVKEKTAAHREYSEAVNRGQTAAKVDLTARDANCFTVTVNVEARTKATFNLTYEELLPRRLGVYSNIINIAPGEILSNLTVLVNIEESNNLTSLQVPSFRLSNEALYDDSETENDPLAVIERPAPNKATIRWSPSADQQRELNKGSVKGLFTVEYDVERRDNPSQILVSDGYFVHFYSPYELQPLNKHVVFMLDTSGSMYGSKLRQLKEAMKQILSDLREGDFFTIATFATRTKIFYLPKSSQEEFINDNPMERVSIQECVIPVVPENIHNAKEYIHNLKVQGGTLKVGTKGTNIKAALITSIKLVRNARNELRTAKPNMASRRLPKPMIIFLTVGEATSGETNLPTILEKVEQKNARLQVPIFTLAFGRDADKEFLKKLSLKNYAFSRVIYEASDAALQLRDFYRQIASPLLSIVTFHYLPEQVENDLMSNLHYNTLYNGCELVVVGKLANASNTVEGDIVAKSSTGKYQYAFSTLTTSVTLPPRQDNLAPDFMEKLWAYVNVRQMLDKLMVEGDNSTSKYLASAVAMKYSFVTPLTSLLVVKPNKASLVDVEDAGIPDRVMVPSSRSRLLREIILNSLRSGDLRPILDDFNMKLSGDLDEPPTLETAADFSEPSTLTTYVQVYTLVTDDIIIANDTSVLHSAPTSLLSMENVSWMASTQTNNGTHIFITNDGQTVAYEICTNQTNTMFDPCNNGTGTPSHCRHLPYCVLPAFKHDFTTYVSSYFCEIQGFAGSCCPDALNYV